MIDVSDVIVSLDFPQYVKIIEYIYCSAAPTEPGERRIVGASSHRDGTRVQIEIVAAVTSTGELGWQLPRMRIDFEHTRRAQELDSLRKSFVPTYLRLGDPFAFPDESSRLNSPT